MVFNYLKESFKSHFTFNRSTAKDIRKIIKQLFLLSEELHSDDLSLQKLEFYLKTKDGNGILILLSKLYSIIEKSEYEIAQLEDLLTRFEIKLFRKSDLVDLLDFIKKIEVRVSDKPDYAELYEILKQVRNNLETLRTDFFKEIKNVILLLRAEEYDQTILKSLLLTDSIVSRAVSTDGELRSLINHVPKDTKHLLKELKKILGLFEKNDIRHLKKHIDSLKALSDSFAKDLEQSLSDILFLFKVAVHFYFKIVHKSEQLFKGYERLLLENNFSKELLSIIDDAVKKRNKKFIDDEKHLEEANIRLARHVA